MLEDGAEVGKALERVVGAEKAEPAQLFAERLQREKTLHDVRPIQTVHAVRAEETCLNPAVVRTRYTGAEEAK